MKFSKILITSILMMSSNIAIAKSGGDDAGNGGNNYLTRTGVSQYTCITYAFEYNTKNEMVRTDSAKSYLNYLEDRLPAAILDSRLYSCHDEKKYGIEDSYSYPRLDLIPNAFILYSRFNTRFNLMANGRRAIDMTIDLRIKDEYNIKVQTDLFKIFNLPSSNGFILKPFVNSKTNEYFCPSNKYIDIPFVNIVIDYTGETEGLYLGELEAKSLSTPNGAELVKSTLLVSDSNIMKYGFFLKDGQYHRVTLESSIDTEKVMFYYPFSDSQDPLVKGDRDLVVVRPTEDSATKKIGCIFKSEK